MNELEKKVNDLEERLNSLQQSFIQSEINRVPITEKNDKASSEIPLINENIAVITPYTVTKQAYIDDTEITFTDVPTGNLSVYMQDSEGNYPDFTVERSGDRVTVSFEPLEQVTTVTISVL